MRKYYKQAREPANGSVMPIIEVPIGPPYGTIPVNTLHLYSAVPIPRRPIQRLTY